MLFITNTYTMLQIDDVETTAMKAGKKVCSKLEVRIKELETELDTEQGRNKWIKYLFTF